LQQPPCRCADGTFTASGDVAGTYVLDGYLLMISPRGAPSYVNVVGMAGLMLANGSAFYVRE